MSTSQKLTEATREPCRQTDRQTLERTRKTQARLKSPIGAGGASASSRTKPNRRRPLKHSLPLLFSPVLPLLVVHGSRDHHHRPPQQRQIHPGVPLPLGPAPAQEHRAFLVFRRHLDHAPLTLAVGICWGKSGGFRLREGWGGGREGRDTLPAVAVDVCLVCLCCSC